MKNPPDNPSIILASKSPRRRYLLEKAGLQFSVIPSNFEENSVTATSPGSYVEALARLKALDISAKFPDSWVIGADTIVSVDGNILGKPVSRADARTMLDSLSNRTHQVLTGFCVCCGNGQRIFSDMVTTDVQFKKLSAREIDWYIQTGEPFDKAGAYAIQGLGMLLVRSINGSYTNVVGLPVCEVAELLMQEGVMDLQSIDKGNSE
jgi:septum formation protein